MSAQRSLGRAAQDNPRTRGYLAAVALAALTIGALAASLLWSRLGADSGTAQPVDSGWHDPGLNLPAGVRYAYYDVATDTIWLLTRPNSRIGIPDSGAILTSFTVGSGEWRSYDVPGENGSLGAGAGLAVDRSGSVWMAWGERLLRFQPADERLEEWKIPSGQLAPAAAPSPGLDGMATSLALQQGAKLEGVLVAVYGESQVRRFDPAAGSWGAEVPTGGVVVTYLTSIAVSPTTLVINGAVREGDGQSRPAISLIDLASNRSRLGPLPAYRFAARADGTVAFLGPEGLIGVLDSSGRETARVAAVPLIGPDASVSVSPSGEVWFWAYSSGDVNLVRASQDISKLDAFPYPLSNYVDLRYAPISRPIEPGPDEELVRLDPGIRALLVDIRGDVWVVSSHGSNPEAGQARGAYPVLYRFHP
jgi:hypothetical protein